MSISTQPIARQASIQRAPSARLNIASDADRAEPADKMQQNAGPTAFERAVKLQPSDAKCLMHIAPLKYSGVLQSTALQAQGLLPAASSGVASHLQARMSASLTCQQACPIKQAQVSDAAAKAYSMNVLEDISQGSKRQRTSPKSSLRPSLFDEAGSLEAEYAAMKAGTTIITDRAAWVQAAKRAAHQVHRSCQKQAVKPIRTFKSSVVPNVDSSPVPAF